MFKDDFQTIARAHHLSLSTERSYWHCARSHIKRLGAKSAQDLHRNPTEQFREHLTALANLDERIEGDEGVSASTQSLFFHALRFLYEKVLGLPLGDLSKIPRAVGHERIVEVPDDETAKRIVSSVPGVSGVALRLIYGTGSRLNDVLRLRVKDLDFQRRLIAIQQSKGDKARLVPMPASLIPELSALVRERERIHDSDLEDGFGWVHLPGQLAKKYPGGENSLGWQYLFPSSTRSKDPRTGKTGRHHIFDVTLQRAFVAARKKLRLRRRYTIHSLRHSAAQFWERSGVPRSQIQQLLGHAHSSTTDRYLVSGVKSVARLPTPL
jgi:integrase